MYTVGITHVPFCILHFQTFYVWHICQTVWHTSQTKRIDTDRDEWKRPSWWVSYSLNEKQLVSIIQYEKDVLGKCHRVWKRPVWWVSYRIKETYLMSVIQNEKDTSHKKRRMKETYLGSAIQFERDTNEIPFVSSIQCEKDVFVDCHRTWKRPIWWVSYSMKKIYFAIVTQYERDLFGECHTV